MIQNGKKNLFTTIDVKNRYRYYIVEKGKERIIRIFHFEPRKITHIGKARFRAK